MDADFLLHHYSNDEKSIRSMLEHIIAAPTENDYVNFEIKDLTPIALKQTYHGIQAGLIAHIKRLRIPIFIDFGVGDVVVPKPQRKAFTSLLPDQQVPSVLVYSVESTIAEKYDAIVQRMKQTSRMKDFFDIYLLSKTFSFDGVLLQAALQQTLINRKTEHRIGTFAKIETLSNDTNMLLKWKSFQKGIRATVSFNTIMAEISRFLGPVVTAMMEEQTFSAVWEPENGWN